MEKKKLYLDVDDTILDTENYLREVLGGLWKNFNGLVYEEYDKMNDLELVEAKKVFSDYTKIPYIVGAEDGLKILQSEYDVVLCSSYQDEDERVAKEVWAKAIGLPIVLCEGFTKHLVDMQGSVMVDDNTDNLKSTNADRKVCFYKKYHCFDLSSCDIVFSWMELVDKLCPNKRTCGNIDLLKLNVG